MPNVKKSAYIIKADKLETQTNKVDSLDSEINPENYPSAQAVVEKLNTKQDKFATVTKTEQGATDIYIGTYPSIKGHTDGGEVSLSLGSMSASVNRPFVVREPEDFSIDENVFPDFAATRKYVNSRISVTEDNGTILNDFEHNNAKAPYSLAGGAGTYAGYKVHKIVSYDSETDTLVLDSDASTLAVDDVISIDGDINYPYCAIITNVNSNTVTVDRKIVSYLDKTTPIDLTKDEFFLFVDGKPNTGTNALGGGIKELGDGTKVLGGGQIAMGLGNHAIAEGAAAFGRENFASGSYAFAAGRDNIVCSHSIALGKQNTVKGMISAAIGVENIISDRFGVAIGQGNEVTSPEGMAFGTRNKAKGEGSLALGWESVASGFHAITLNGKASGSGAVAIRGNAQGEHSIALGSNGIATGLHAIALNGEANGERSFAANTSTAKGNNSASFGYGGEAIGNYSFVANKSNKASSECSTAFGSETQSNGWASFSIGTTTQANGRFSFAGGQSSIARGECSFALGRAVKTNANTVAQFAVGRHNAGVEGAMFIVGNGDSDAALSNAFVVMKDGYAELPSIKNNDIGTSDNAITTKGFVENQINILIGVGTSLDEATDDNKFFVVID